MKAIPGAWLDRLLQEGLPCSIRLGNHVWTREDKKSTSVHYVSEDGWRMRISDHWCGEFPSATGSPMRVKSVGKRKIVLEAGGRSPYRGGIAGAIGRFER